MALGSSATEIEVKHTLRGRRASKSSKTEGDASAFKGDWEQQSIGHGVAAEFTRAAGVAEQRGSLAFVADRNSPAAAFEMGHKGETRTLFKHYRKNVKPTAAKKFWAIKPTKKGE